MRIFSILAVLVLVSVSLAWSSGHERIDCSYCHLGVPGHGDVALLKDDISRACLSCHRGFDQGHSHNVSAIRAQIPTHFPLNSSGEMTCATCHNLCADEPAQPYLLRASAERNFCRNCHGNSLLPEEGRHLGLAGTAHRQTNLDHAADGFLDETTMDCLMCHGDGILAPAVEVSTNSGGGRAIGHSHPLGMNYEERSIDNRGLRDPGQLPSNMIFPGGQMGCLSCHDMYAKQPPFLVVSNKGSALCLTCHIR